MCKSCFPPALVNAGAVRVTGCFDCDLNTGIYTIIRGNSDDMTWAGIANINVENITCSVDKICVYLVFNG